MKSETSQKWSMCSPRGGGDAVYGLGLVGALFYFLQHAPTFTDKLLAILKAFVWPALTVFKLLEFLKM